jgi:hypothetical protein
MRMMITPFSAGWICGKCRIYRRFLRRLVADAEQLHDLRLQILAPPVAEPGVINPTEPERPTQSASRRDRNAAVLWKYAGRSADRPRCTWRVISSAKT